LGIKNGEFYMRKTRPYIAHRGHSLVTALSITVLAFLMLMSIAGAVAVVGEGPYAYITNSASKNVSVIDTASNTVTATINVGSLPFGVVARPDGKKVYVTNYLSNNVSVIDTKTNRVTASIDVGTLPFGIAVNPKGTRVYVANYLNNSVSVICTTADAVISSVDLGNSPWEVAVSPNGEKVYVTSLNSNNISIINTTNNTVASKINVGSPSFGVAVSPDGKKVYVTKPDNKTVSVIDTVSNTVTATVNVGNGPWELAISPDGKKIYVANSDSDTISVIDSTLNTVTATVKVGSLPCGVSVNPEGTKVYVANQNNNNVSVIDTVTNTVTATVNVGNLPAAFGKFIVPLSSVLPAADFSCNSTNGYAPLSVKFADLSNNANAWNWSFGDGATSSKQNPEHTYLAAGNYTVNLTVSNANGTDSTSSYITVLNGISTFNAAFSVSPDSGTAPLNANFTDKSTGSPTSWKWYFGDGASSTEQNPSHIYNKTGLYSVTLTTSRLANISTVTKNNYIAISNGIVTPISAFSASPNSGKAPLNVRFTDMSTGSITSWKWYFGDGNNSTEQNPTYTYNNTGQYAVTLTVSNTDASYSLTKYRHISVGNSLEVPVPAFSAFPTSGKAPLNVSFTDMSTGSPTSWKWNFGDGTTSTEKNPTHTYSNAGKYTVSLTAINAGGSSSGNKVGYITVS
jgi:YVTN family beta-propeller protein